MNRVTWQYVAGFFDGEGHVCVKKSKFQLGLTQTTRPVLEAIAEFLAAQGIRAGVYTSSRPRPVGWAPQSKLLVSTREHVVRILREMYPWLIVKRLYAQDILRYAVLFPPTHYRNRMHCAGGHELTPSNITGHQHRRCRICANSNNRASYHRQRAS